MHLIFFLNIFKFIDIINKKFILLLITINSIYEQYVVFFHKWSLNIDDIEVCEINFNLDINIYTFTGGSNYTLTNLTWLLAFWFSLYIYNIIYIYILYFFVFSFSFLCVHACAYMRIHLMIPTLWLWIYVFVTNLKYTLE